MYKNQTLPQTTRSVVIDKNTYEIVCNVKQDSILADWELSVKRTGKIISKIHGLLCLDKNTGNLK
jgi:hypothetical protein